MSKGNLAALKDRTLQGYQRLLKNDKLVRIGQDVTVGGTIFKVVSVTEGKISLQSEAGVILNSATDAKGNVTLSVPQAGGTTKIYNVKIDPQGVITLSLRAK